MSDADLVRLRDARELRYCARGCREWCRRYGIDWAAFRAPGVPAAQILATGDAMAAHVVAHARAKRG